MAIRTTGHAEGAALLEPSPQVRPTSRIREGRTCWETFQGTLRRSRRIRFCTGMSNGADDSDYGCIPFGGMPISVAA